jgi:hypothetical protein
VPPRGSLAGPTIRVDGGRDQPYCMYPFLGLGSSSTASLHFGWLAVVLFHVYVCFSTVVSSTTRSTISPAMSSAALRSSSFLWATSTRAACQADQ